jgi:hypothetical protein
MYAPRNTSRVSRQNRFIEDELVKYGELKDSRSKFASEPVFRRKAKSVTTRANEASERRYTRRSNICDICHTTKSMAGTCDCD